MPTEDDQPIVYVIADPEIWDVNDRQPVMMPDCSEDASGAQKEALARRMSQAMQLRAMRAYQTHKIIQAIIEGLGFYEP